MNLIGGIRSLVVAKGVVNARCWADDAPEKATFPYVTLIDAISIAPVLEGDGGAMRQLERLVQADLWQRDGEEDDAVLASLYEALHGVKVAGTNIALRVRDIQRFHEPETRIVHHALTLAARHDHSGL